MLCLDDDYGFILQKQIQANDDWPYKQYFWICLKTRAGQESFWKLVPRHNFPNLRSCSEIVHSCFGSTFQLIFVWICVFLPKNDKE
jgi:hypothetical protein